MSGASQIHIFVGAPIIPTLLKKPKEDISSTDTFEKWKKLYLSFTKDTSLLCAKKDRCPDHADHQMPKSEALTACFKDEFTPNFGGKSEIANLTDCAVYSQSIKSFSNTNEIGESTGIICHVSGDVNSTKNQINHLVYKELFNPVKTNEQQSKQSEDNEEDINSMKHNDFDISPLAPSISRNINKMKSAEQDDNPPAFQCDHCQPLGQYVKTSCPQKMDKSKMDKPLHLCTCLGISTDTEYHSILTSSQAALLSGRHAVGQNSIPIKPAQEQGVKMYESCRDLETVLDPFIQINENGSVYPDLDELNCRHTYESSLELFDSNSPEKENLIFEETHFQENVGLSTHHSPDNKPNNELCYTEQSKTETLCFQRDLSAKRPRTFEDISPAIHFRSGNEKRSKKAMSAYSSICPVPRVKEQNILRSKTVQKYSSLLKECISKGQKYTVLVTVLHPCHVKEIKIKSGTKLPSRVPLATVVIFDQSEIQRKVVLWRAAAFWSLTVFPGDIILLTDVILYENSWTGETMLQSTFTTQLLNLGSCSNIHPNEFSHIVAVNILQDLLTYVSSKHAYLETLPQRKRQTLNNIQHVLLDELRPDVLVHSVLKIVDLTVLTESTYSFKGETQRKIVLTVEQIKDQNYTLVLWGALTALYPQLQRKRDHIWEFKYLFTKHNPVSGELELHTTPWSTLECLFDDDQRAVKFKEKFEKDLRLFTCVTTLATHLEEKCSGVIQVKAHISELKFTVASSPHEIVLDASASLQYIVTSLALITYVGCAKCGRELQADENKIYKQCNQCLPSNKVKTFYRPAQMIIEEGGYEICVQVTSELIEKIFLNIPAEWQSKTIEPSLDTTYGMIVADLCHALLTDTKATYLLTIRSHFILDENSYPLEKDFHLLSFHLDL